MSYAEGVVTNGLAIVAMSTVCWMCQPAFFHLPFEIAKLRMQS